MIQRSAGRAMPAVLSLLLAAPLAAQTTAPADSARALAVLRQAVEAHGGDAAVLRPGTVVVEAESQRRVAGQGYQPADEAAIRATFRSVIDPANGRVRLEQDQLWPGGYRFPAVNVLFQAGPGFAYDPDMFRGGSDLTRMTPEQVAAALAGSGRALPHLVLQQALQQAATLRYVGDGERGGRPVRTIAYTDAVGAELVLHFEARTGLMAAYERRTAGAPAITTDFGEYRVEGGVRVPAGYRVTQEGAPVVEWTLTRVSLGAPVADSLFAEPAGYAERP
ncbi:MAG TPA: hypothetical protein VNP72_02910, partial [Longimicrobium sp.]|nr:hypothetical protein [Longimicrobium sp.]